MSGDTIVVMHRRIPGHRAKGAGEPHPKMSYGIVLHSNDGGKTWSEPYDLRDCMKPEDRNRGGIVPLSHRAKFDKGNRSPLGYKVHLHAIGTARDSAVIAVNNHGVFRSDDAGRTWKHFSQALREDTFKHPIINIGPRILDDPKHGLLVFGNWFGEVDQYHKYSQKLVVLRSPDGGATWQIEEYPAKFKQYEPAAIFHDGKYHIVTRDQNAARSHRQMTWLPGEEPTITKTNLQDPRFVDTVDLSFNPLTKRFEIVRSERHHMELWLWSIAPEDWHKGEWRRECRLYRRLGRFYADADGFHPAGSVIDEKRRVQHIFIYTGHPNGPAGVFRLTRTSDTPKLAEFLKPRNRPDNRDTVHWTGNAKSANWSDSGNWDIGVPDQHDVVIIGQRAAGQSIHVDDVVQIGRIELRLKKKNDRLTLTGSGTLVIHGAESIRNKYSTALIQTGILDLGPELNVEIRNQRFVAGNQDGTVVIRSNRVRAGKKEATSNSYESDGENLKLSITDRGRFLLMTEHWEPGMSLDMSASHTEGLKVFDFALNGVQQGVTFIRLKEHDGDPVEIYGFDESDFFRFRANPLTSCDEGKEFRIDAVKFVGWPNNGKAAIEPRGDYWYLKPATGSLPATVP